MKKYVENKTYDGTNIDTFDKSQFVKPYKNSQLSILLRIFITQDFTGKWRNLFHKGNSDQERTFATWLSPNTNTLHCRISTTHNKNDGFNSKSVLKINQWYTVAFVLSDDTYSLYIDNILDTCYKLPGKVIFNNGPLYIGKNPWYNGFVGKMSEFKIYSKAITNFQSDDLENLEDEKISSLGNSLNLLLQTSMFSNYKIILNSEEIKCHRSLLAVRSKFFLKLFESKMEDSKNDFIELKDFEDKLMKIAINFIYTDVLKTKGCFGSDLIDLMNIGNFLEIDNFSKKISQKIEFILSIENIFEIYLKSFEYDFQEVQNSCVEFIVFHYKEIIVHPKFLELPKECMSQVFKAYVKE